MNASDHLAVFMAAFLFALGAVALIIYQHVQATNSVLAAVGSAGPTLAPGATILADTGGLGVSASLAGSPIIGQDGSSAPPSVEPLNINPGYTIQ